MPPDFSPFGYPIFSATIPTHSVTMSPCHIFPIHIYCWTSFPERQRRPFSHWMIVTRPPPDDDDRPPPEDEHETRTHVRHRKTGRRARFIAPVFPAQFGFASSVPSMRPTTIVSPVQRRLPQEASDEPFRPAWGPELATVSPDAVPGPFDLVPRGTSTWHRAGSQDDELRPFSESGSTGEQR
jgi:hypothetical protein